MASNWPPKKNVAFTMYFFVYKNDGTIIANPTLTGSNVHVDGNTTEVTDSTLAVVDSTTGLCSIVLAQATMNGDQIDGTITSSSTGAVVYTFKLMTTANTQDEIGADVAATHTHAAGAETQATEANAHAHTIDGHITADYGATEKAAIDLLDDADGGLADIHTVVNDLHTDVADVHTDVGAAITAIGDAALATAASLADVPTNAELATALGTADGAVLAAVAELKDFDPATDVVAHVTLVDTTTTNTDMVAAAPAASAVADAVWDEAIAGHAGAGSTGAALSAATAPSAATIADAVWDEAIAGHAGAGSAGAALAAAGSAGDPWSTLIPGAYGAGTAGKILGDNINAPIGTVDIVVDAIKAKTDTIGSGTVTAVSPVAAGGAVSIIAGDSYDADDGRELSWTGTTWPSLVGATVVMKVTGASYACTVTGAGTASQTVVCELTKVQTAALAVITHSMDVEATLASGNLVTLVRSTMTVAGAGA